MQKPTTPNERLIFALDVANVEEAEGLVNELKGVVSFYKVGWELFLSTGLNFVKKLRNEGYKVFLDIKLPDDVDETISRTVKNVVEVGAQFITIHGNGRTAEIAKEAKGDSDLKILAVTLLTNMDQYDLCDMLSMDYTEFSKNIGTLDDYVVKRAKKCLASGCDGLISSGRNAERLRQELGNQFTLVCPGIRPEGHSSNEHKRAVTPREAILNRADYLVVGRPIRDASDRLGMAKKIIDEIAGAEEAIKESAYV